MIKKLWSWLVTIIKETLNLSWTLVGLVIATLTLTGSAQQITGLATIITLGIWLLTITSILEMLFIIHQRKDQLIVLIQMVILLLKHGLKVNYLRKDFIL